MHTCSMYTEIDFNEGKQLGTIARTYVRAYTMYNPNHTTIIR